MNIREVVRMKERRDDDLFAKAGIAALLIQALFTFIDLMSSCSIKS